MDQLQVAKAVAKLASALDSSPQDVLDGLVGKEISEEDAGRVRELFAGEHRDEIDPERLGAAESGARKFAQALDSLLPPSMGFAVLIFSFDGPEMSYISNAERSTMVKAMKEFTEAAESYSDFPSVSNPEAHDDNRETQ